MKLSEIQKRLNAITNDHVWIDISICNLSSVQTEISTYKNKTEETVKHPSIAAALAYLEMATVDGEIEDDAPSNDHLVEMGFGVAGGDK